MTTKTDMQKQAEALQKELDKLNNQIESMPDDKPKQWEPKGGDYKVYGSGDIIRDTGNYSYRKFGTEYPTEEQAEKARDAMRVHNRLLAYVAEFDAGWVADWSDDSQAKFFACYGYGVKRWFKDYDVNSRPSVGIYMSEQCADGLVKKLNSGEVVL